MALDFHRLDNREYFFGIDDKRYKNIDEVFTEYKNWTGVCIDQYGDSKLIVGNQKMLVKITDTCIEKESLNTDKQKKVNILEFKTLLNYFSDKSLDIEILAD